jgi:hypothetical protein
VQFRLPLGAPLLPSQIPLDPAYAVHCFFLNKLLVLREFAVFVMFFFEVTQNFSLLEATAES